MSQNFADRQRAHDAADVSLRLVFGDEYVMLSSAEMLAVRTDFLRFFDTQYADGKTGTASAYRDRIGKGNLQSYARALPGYTGDQP